MTTCARAPKCADHSSAFTRDQAEAFPWSSWGQTCHDNISIRTPPTIAVARICIFLYVSSFIDLPVVLCVRVYAYFVNWLTATFINRLLHRASKCGKRTLVRYDLDWETEQSPESYFKFCFVESVAKFVPHSCGCAEDTLSETMFASYLKFEDSYEYTINDYFVSDVTDFALLSAKMFGIQLKRIVTWLRVTKNYCVVFSYSQLRCFLLQRCVEPVGENHRRILNLLQFLNAEKSSATAVFI